ESRIWVGASLLSLGLRIHFPKQLLLSRVRKSDRREITMKLEFRRNLRSLLLLAMGIVALSNVNVARAQDTDNGDGRSLALRGRIVAVGIPGASTVTAIGTFLPGGPIH